MKTICKSFDESTNRRIDESKNSHGGFTLVEMLIVVALLAVLMSITFKLGSITDDDSRRTTTIVRMQKIENCISGYYAAFGSYPPVKVHGSRDIYVGVNASGDQDASEGRESSLNWSSVKAACRSQPFGCEYPGDDRDREVIEEYAEDLKEHVEKSDEYPEYAKSSYAAVFQAGFTGPSPSDFTGVWDESDWKVVKLFKFGMMSFLLPRYLFMMGGDSKFFGGTGAAGSTGACAQWTDSNDMPCDPFEGETYGSWSDLRDDAQTSAQGTDNSVNRSDLARVANIPSQAVCARWMPNLQGICTTLRSMTFFGINITGDSDLELNDDYPPDPEVHEPEGHKGKYYKNATITVKDGWENEFYYYSPSPYQSYTVWSAGANGKTFPPWMPVDKLQGKDRETAMDWKNDDIIQMSH